MDLYPTLLEMVGEKKAGQNGVDGVSLVPLLRNDGQLTRLGGFDPSAKNFQFARD
jgi:arylsulfatase A-like enzyme